MERVLLGLRGVGAGRDRVDGRCCAELRRGLFVHVVSEQNCNERLSTFKGQQEGLESLAPTSALVVLPQERLQRAAPAVAAQKKEAGAMAP